MDIEGTTATDEVNDTDDMNIFRLVDCYASTKRLKMRVRKNV